MENLTLLIAGASSGLIAGLAGLGGGAVIVPVLVSLYGQAALHDAIVVSWFAVLFNSLSAAIRQYRIRTPDERAKLIAASRYFLIGVLVVTPVVAVVMTGVKNAVTPTMVGALQLTLALALLWPKSEAATPRTMSRAVDAGWGALVGGASTVIGIGGGAYTTAYMIYGPRRPLRDAIAAANLTGLAVGALAVAGYLATLAFSQNASHAAGEQSPISLTGMAIILIGGTLFSGLGVKLSQRMPTAVLKKILVAVLSLSALRLLMS